MAGLSVEQLGADRGQEAIDGSMADVSSKRTNSHAVSKQDCPGTWVATI